LLTVENHFSEDSANLSIMALSSTVCGVFVAILGMFVIAAESLPVKDNGANNTVNTTELKTAFIRIQNRIVRIAGDEKDMEINSFLHVCIDQTSNDKFVEISLDAVTVEQLRLADMQRWERPLESLIRNGGTPSNNLCEFRAVLNGLSSQIRSVAKLADHIAKRRTKFGMAEQRLRWEELVQELQGTLPSLLSSAVPAKGLSCATNSNPATNQEITLPNLDLADALDYANSRRLLLAFVCQLHNGFRRLATVL
jgi:hypothetical protein